ncbi:GAF domain-containing sensor histidine kinase [Halorubellus salinus]|uniref:GAF domain-containing sensor histidine kinase n=1 Tax=Halorubellus salinus TaxID=755309 RepID=UPI001D093E8A|nr:ATP-binding protein [Halorubellus salinus]
MHEEWSGTPRVVLVTDAASSVDASAFDAVGASVRTVEATEDGLGSVPADASVVVTAYELPRTDGVAVVESVAGDVPVVVYARDGDEHVASEAVRAGADDYVPIPADAPADRVPDVVRDRALAVAVTDGGSDADPAGDTDDPDDAEDPAAGSMPPTRASVEDRERALQRAYQVVADADRPFGEKVEDLLGIVREAVGTSYATLSYVDGGDYTFEYVDAPGKDDVAAGDTVALETTNCDEVVSTQETLVLEDVERDAPELADRAGNAEWGISCYLGAPVTVDGDAYGTFCFYDKEARSEAFSEWQVTFVELFGDWVSHELERERYVDRLAALNDLHSVVRTLTDAVMHRSDRLEMERTVVDQLADTGSYALAWVDALDGATGEELRTVAFADADADDSVLAADAELALPVDGAHGHQGTDSDGEGSRDGTADGDEDAVDLAVAAFDGHEVRTRDVVAGDGRMGVLADRGLERWAAVPVAFDEESFGVLNVATYRREGFSGRELAVLGQVGEILGLAIATVERGAVVEQERERLEFVNRFIRHNLLNSLNVVEARTEILDAHVDDAGRSHLETIQGRTADMVELIETLRALMQAFVVDESRETEPVDLRAVVEAEVEGAREAFGHAAFSLSVPDERVTVRADRLLGEVFENLLANAVQHNDRASPSVSVSVVADASTATVRVVDDGPGIPEDVLPAVFEKGERGFDSPGTGFGLYLVREIVDAYDGSVSVQNDDDGATFTVSLPRDAPDGEDGAPDED